MTYRRLERSFGMVTMSYTCCIVHKGELHVDSMCSKTPQHKTRQNTKKSRQLKQIVPASIVYQQVKESYERGSELPIRFGVSLKVKNGQKPQNEKTEKMHTESKGYPLIVFPTPRLFLPKGRFQGGGTTVQILINKVGFFSYASCYVR